MTTYEKLAMLNNLVDAYTDMFGEKCDTARRSIGLSLESEWGASACRMASLAVEAVSAAIGDECGWVEWYLYECDAGRDPHRACVDGVELDVRSTDELVRVIIETGGDA